MVLDIYFEEVNIIEELTEEKYEQIYVFKDEEIKMVAIEVAVKELSLKNK